MPRKIICHYILFSGFDSVRRSVLCVLRWKKTAYICWQRWGSWLYSMELYGFTIQSANFTCVTLKCLRKEWRWRWRDARASRDRVSKNKRNWRRTVRGDNFRRAQIRHSAQMRFFTLVHNIVYTHILVFFNNFNTFNRLYIHIYIYIILLLVRVKLYLFLLTKSYTYL